MIYEAFTLSITFNKHCEEKRKLLAPRRKEKSNVFSYSFNTILRRLEVKEALK